jgi:hypothetical protein
MSFYYAKKIGKSRNIFAMNSKIAVFFFLRSGRVLAGSAPMRV